MPSNFRGSSLRRFERTLRMRFITYPENDFTKNQLTPQRDIVELRKGDHSAERLQIERERLDLEREKTEKRMREKLEELRKELETKRNGGLSQEGLAEIERAAKILR
jgi:hypothetical protein